MKHQFLLQQHYLVLDENQTAIGSISATDEDGDDVTFTITGDELAVTSAGVLTFISAPDFETKI